MERLASKVYRAGAIEVAVAERCVRRDGELLHLRPRSFDLLVYLIERRDRIVSRQELLDALWPGTTVTENTIMQSVNEARKLLNDDPRDSRFIRTVSKAGYQFIGPIDETGGYVEEITTLEMEYEEQPALPGPRPQWWWRWLAAVGVMAVVLGGFGLWRFSGSSARAGTVIVLPFENSSTTAELDWLREGLPDMLITNLSRAGGMHILGREQVRALLAPGGADQQPSRVFDRAMAWGKEHGADTIITGSFARLGGKLRVAIQIYRTADGSLRNSESFTADRPEQILTHMDLASLQLASALGRPIKQEDRLAGLSSLMTPNLEAYRYYTLGMEKADTMAAPEAIELFKKAVALDPNFAMAHARIGYAYTSPGGRPAEAKPSLETAFRLSSRLTPTDRLHIAAWYALANLDYPAAVRAYQSLVANNPRDVEAYTRLGALLSGERRVAESIAVLQQALVIDPNSAPTWNTLSGTQNRAGWGEQAVISAQRYVALMPAEPNAWDSLGLALHVAGKMAEAESAYRRALSLKPGFQVATIHLANLAYQRGRYREALSYCEQFVAGAKAPYERGRGHGCLATIYGRRNQQKEAAAAALTAIQFDPAAIYDPAMVALRQGDPARAEKLAQTKLHVNDRGRRVQGRTRMVLLGTIAMSRGRTEDALTAFRGAIEENPPIFNLEWHEDCLANAYLTLGRYEEAVAEYQRALAKFPGVATMRYHLAVAYERLGKRDEARAEYRRFVNDWKGADADVPELVLARRY